MSPSPLQKPRQRRPIGRAVAWFVVAIALSALATVGIVSSAANLHAQVSATWGLLIGGSISAGLCGGALAAVCWVEGWRALEKTQRR
jgi:hypothetical protein